MDVRIICGGDLLCKIKHIANSLLHWQLCEACLGAFFPVLQHALSRDAESALVHALLVLQHVFEAWLCAPYAQETLEYVAAE